MHELTKENIPFHKRMQMKISESAVCHDTYRSDHGCSRNKVGNGEHMMCCDENKRCRNRSSTAPCHLLNRMKHYRRRYSHIWYQRHDLRLHCRPVLV